MANADLRMFMDDLKKIIHGNHHPLFNKHPFIIAARPRLQLLYLELDSIIQTLFGIHEDHHHPHELKKVKRLKKRFKDAAKEAQDSFDLFLSALHFRNIRLSPRSRQSTKAYLDLHKIHKSIKSIKAELKTINIGNMKMDSSSRFDHVKNRQSVAAGTSYTRNPLGIRKPSEEIVVGLDRDVEIIRDKLAEDSKQLSIVSIVGMGGIGKTTLATKLFNDSFINYHFHVRAWATVSQTYAKRDLMIQILTSMGLQEDLEKDHDSKLREKLHKKLMGRRYFIVIDDIWSIEAWDELKMFFPHDNTASRIILTSRLNEVALHVKPNGFVHSLPCLTEEESWELLKQKVFHGDECPEWLIKPGIQIAKKCHGLPLSVVVMAGVLVEEPMNNDLWEEIACSVSSYIVNDQKGCLDTLALSYHHLPDYLRECFLYLGGFPEDFRINVKKLIWLWVAEGFIAEVGNRSLEDTAKAYLMDLISKNLVIVAKRNAIGDVKACKLHDFVRELCLQKAKEGLFLKVDSSTSSSQLLEGITYKQRRVFTNQNVNIFHVRHSVTPTIQSLLCFHLNVFSLKPIACSFVLLRVLDLQKCLLDDCPPEVALLVHLRYLVVWYSSIFPNSICNLWSLQTLILRTSSTFVYLPRNITDLVNLRHLWSSSWLHLPCIEKPMNLHSISKVRLKDGVGNVQKCFPNLRKLALDYDYKFQKWAKYLELLPYLENLKLSGSGMPWERIAFPATLKKLSILDTVPSLPCSHMPNIELLPNLEVLKICGGLFLKRRRWDACEQQFRQLKFLKLQSLDIIQWEASSSSFPCLKQLSVWHCRDLNEIPVEIGEIATLELIEIRGFNHLLLESVKRIQQEQQDAGNYELKITADGMELSSYLSRIEGSRSESEGEDDVDSYYYVNYNSNWGSDLMF